MGLWVIRRGVKQRDVCGGGPTWRREATTRERSEVAKETRNLARKSQVERERSCGKEKQEG